MASPAQMNRVRDLLANVWLSPALLLTMGLLIVGLGDNRALAASGVLIEGKLVNGTNMDSDLSGFPIVLHQQGAEAYKQVETATDSLGRFLFADVEEVPGSAYGISVDYKGVLYGRDLDLNPARIEPITITVYETTDHEGVLSATSVSTVFGGVDRRGQWVEVLEMVVVQNLGDRTYVPGPDPMKLLRFALPPGARDLQVRSDLLRAEVLQVDQGFGLTAAVPPGGHDILFSYRFPYEGPMLSFTKSLPYGADRLQILVPQGDLWVESAQLVEAETVSIGNLTYHQWASQNVPAGTRVEMMLKGLPQPSFWERLARNAEEIPFQYVPPVSLILVVALVIAYGLIRSRGNQPRKDAEERSGPMDETCEEAQE